MDDSINKFSDVSAEYKILRDMYPYQEPRESEIMHKEQCIAIVAKLYQLEMDCLKSLKEINKSISLFLNGFGIGRYYSVIGDCKLAAPFFMLVTCILILHRAFHYRGTLVYLSEI